VIAERTEDNLLKKLPSSPENLGWIRQRKIIYL